MKEHKKYCKSKDLKAIHQKKKKGKKLLISVCGLFYYEHLF